MQNSANIMRFALIVSIILHVLFMVFSGHELRATTHGQTMDVDIVSANEIPVPAEQAKPDKDTTELKRESAEPKRETLGSEPSNERASAEQRTGRAEEAKPRHEPPPANELPTAKESPTAQTSLIKSIKRDAPRTNDQKPTQTPPDQIGAQPQNPGEQTKSARDMAPDRLAAILGVPADATGPSVPAGFGRAPERMSKRTEGVKELKAQLNKCLVLPPGITHTDRIKMIMRIELARDGALARDPIVIDGAAPAIGYPMMLTAIRALRRCAPYQLPADKYAEWKVLEIDFSPDEMLDN